MLICMYGVLYKNRVFRRFRRYVFQSDLKKTFFFPLNVDIYLELGYSELRSIQKLCRVVVWHESVEVE